MSFPSLACRAQHYQLLRRTHVPQCKLQVLDEGRHAVLQSRHEYAKAHEIRAPQAGTSEWVASVSASIVSRWSLGPGETPRRRHTPADRATRTRVGNFRSPGLNDYSQATTDDPSEVFCGGSEARAAASLTTFLPRS